MSCEYKEYCDMPSDTVKEYCDKNFYHCARFMLAQAKGREALVDEISATDKEKVFQIISE